MSRQRVLGAACWLLPTVWTTGAAAGPKLADAQKIDACLTAAFHVH